ncbi:MAG: pyrroloquinoline quinone biosynthesis protein B [Saprospiraceae bacterium]|jgi:pyrroloquinoline quinone biosynthesis protein B
MRNFLLLFVTCLLVSCSPEKPVHEAKQVVPVKPNTPDVFLTVLGIAQDAGYPQAGCQKACCEAVRNGKEKVKRVSCLGLVDKKTGQTYLLDATPDFREQLFELNAHLTDNQKSTPTGIFLSHAHIGHYTGLMQLGREAMGAKNVDVYSMPRMQDFLTNNGPWSQLVSLQNIKLQVMKAEKSIHLSDNLSITPFLVPHRDEFSETVGFRIEGKEKSALFIPDIDKWEKWEKDIKTEIQKVDYAFLDGTFYSNGELPGRDMSQIPHPFIEESIDLFSDLTDDEKKKVFFIHLNHTNPLLRKYSEEFEVFSKLGFGLAGEGMIFGL